MPILRDQQGRLLPGSDKLPSAGGRKDKGLTVKAQRATAGGEELIKFWLRVMHGEVLYTVIRTNPKTGEDFEYPIVPSVADMLRASENLRNAGFGSPMSASDLEKQEALSEHGVSADQFDDLTLEEKLKLREEIRAKRIERARSGAECVDLAIIPK